MNFKSEITGGLYVIYIIIYHIYMHAYKSFHSCPTLCDLMGCSPEAPLFMGFSKQEYWSGLPYSPPGDLPDPGIEPTSLPFNLLWQAGSLPLAPPGKYNGI